MNWETNLQRALHRLKFFLTPVHPCSYIKERTAATLFVDPEAHLDPDLYSHLAKLGFRRSGEHVYRPECPGCRACKSVRVPTLAFELSRSQRRNLARNNDLRVVTVPGVFREDHYALYQRYVSARHPGGGMDTSSEEDYRRFMFSPWSDTWLHEIRLDADLLAVAVTDRFADGWSTVYTYYDPRHSGRGLGVYAILWQIEQLRHQGLPWLYLGYWISECAKMAYKSQFRPLEVYDGQAWRSLPAGSRPQPGDQAPL